MTPYARKLIESRLTHESVNALIANAHPFDVSVFFNCKNANQILTDTVLYLLKLIESGETDEQLFFPGQNLWLESKQSGEIALRNALYMKGEIATSNQSKEFHGGTVWQGFLMRVTEDLLSCRLNVFSSLTKRGEFIGNRLNNLTNRVISKQNPAKLGEIRQLKIDTTKRTANGMVCAKGERNPDDLPPERGSKFFSLFVYQVLAINWLINSPSICRIYEHKQRRSVAKRFRAWSKYPLNAWSEVKIDINAIDAIKNTSSKEETGRRAKHWVRAHLRKLSSGNVTLVRPHWRGDETLGVIKSKYKVLSGVE